MTAKMKRRDFITLLGGATMSVPPPAGKPTMMRTGRVG